MKFKNLSIRLSAYFLISGIVFSLILIYIGYRYVRESTIESYLFRMQYECQEVINDVTKSLDEAEHFVKSLKMDYRNNHQISDPHKYMEMIFKVQSNLIAFDVETNEARDRSQFRSEFISFYPNVILKADTSRFETKNAICNQWIKQMLYRSKSAQSPPFYDADKNSRVIIYANAFNYNTEKKIVHATIFCSVSLDPLLRNLKNIKLIESGYSILLNEKKQIVYHPDSTETGKSFNALYSTFYNRKIELCTNINRIVQKNPHTL